jgi:Flp pilus assembly protein TadB
MRTEQDVRRPAPVTVKNARRGTAGLGQAARLAFAALAGCLMLIALVAALSMCWAVHPLLMIAVVGLVAWLGTRVAGFARRSHSRTS